MKLGFRAALRCTGASTAGALRRRLSRHPDPAEPDFEPALATDPLSWQTCTQLSARTRPAAAESGCEAAKDPTVEPQPAGKRRPARGLLVDLMTGDANQEGVV